MTLTKRILRDTIKIDDPINFILANRESNAEIISILERKFVNKNYMSSRIIRIMRIVRRSMIGVNQAGANNIVDNPVFGTVDVEFEVEAIVFAIGEIISGCTVRNNDEYNNVYCNTADASIYLRENKIHESLRANQIIPIVTENVMYEVLHERVSVGGSLFVPSPYCTAYEIMDGADNKIENAALLAQLSSIGRPQDTLPWKTLMKMIYPFKVEQGVPGTIIDIFDGLIGADANNAIAAATTLPKYIVRDARLNLATPRVWGTDRVQDITEGNESGVPNPTILRGMSFENILLAIMANYVNYYNLVKSMTEIYNTEEKIKQHDNLWRIYGKAKI